MCHAGRSRYCLVLKPLPCALPLLVSSVRMQGHHRNATRWWHVHPPVAACIGKGAHGCISLLLPQPEPCRPRFTATQKSDREERKVALAFRGKRPALFCSSRPRPMMRPRAWGTLLRKKRSWAKLVFWPDSV
jgi:hypothetical protein